MGKAARQRRRRRMQYLVNLSYSDPDLFGESWERRIDSWLLQVRKQGHLWAIGKSEQSDMKIFDYVDDAMHILSLCDESVRKEHERYTYDVLSHECSLQIAGITDRRLYSTSNFHRSLQLSAFYQPSRKEPEQ